MKWTCVAADRNAKFSGCREKVRAEPVDVCRPLVCGGSGVKSMGKRIEELINPARLLPCFVLTAIGLLVWLIVKSVNANVVADDVACIFQSLAIMRHGKCGPWVWIDSTYAHFQTLPTMVGLMLSPSYLSANLIGALLTLGVSLLVLLLFARAWLGRGAGLLFAFFYCCPMSPVHISNLFTGCFYSQFAIALFVVLGVWMVSVRSDGDDRPQILSLWNVIVIGLSVFAASLMGIRMVLLLCAPLVITILWMHLYNGAAAKVRSGDALMVFGLVLTLALTSILGVLAYSRVVAPAAGVSFYKTYADDLMRTVQDGDMAVRNIGHVVAGVLRCFGLRFSCRMTSFGGAFMLGGMLISFLLTVVFPIVSLREYRKLSYRERFTLGFSLLSAGMTAVVLVCGQLPRGWEAESCGRYLLLPIVLLSACGVQYVYRHFFTTSSIRDRLMACALMLFCVTAVAQKIPSGEKGRRQKFEALSSKLSARGLTYGYATADNALPLMFYSNDSIHMPHVLVEQKKVSRPGWFMDYDWYHPRTLAQESFLMLTDEELRRFAPDGIGQTAYGNPTRVEHIDDYTILVYDYDIVKNQFLGIVRK